MVLVLAEDRTPGEAAIGGVARLTADPDEVLRKNTPMLSLCEKLAFTEKVMPDDPSIVHVSLNLEK